MVTPEAEDYSEFSKDELSSFFNAIIPFVFILFDFTSFLL